MTDRMFRLLELHQKLDALLAKARKRRIPDPLEIARLRQRKLHLRGRLARLLYPPAASAMSL
ncbi:DUF465 domain-containing protein [Novosphingobium album (ex Hu et al. 2023)]|uniref:DUF465 domain-containing protein n=1 Tax=Novosphingobium album (ex Hu et al. 2023) TaxID=2930093 RepID=A0ABT0B691_9SPHN|nr:DUF465 domain-containing protein [Novosphingobium album (ex Hu et al. 2023)]MCJ2180591.1 DUF465 domain-containing protein [Novosphingobium album (ex Hu et al. 2023)]